MKKYLVGRIVRFIKEWNILKSGQRVLLAVSGGADSVFMTEIFFDLARIFNIGFECIHVNYGLRGEESNRDEEFVRKYCEKKNIFLTVKHIPLDVNRSGVEERARIERYKVFHETLIERGLDLIATAHTMDDNVETVLFNIIRGAGVIGIAGIPPVRGKVIRPILCVERKEIIQYLSHENIRYVSDSSNFDNKYTRNYIRNKILPLFENINSGYRKHFLRTSLILRDLEKWSEQYAQSIKENILIRSEFVHAFRISKTDLPAIVYLNILKDYVASPSYEEVTQYLSIIRSKGGKINLRNIQISFSNQELAFMFKKYNLNKSVFKVGDGLEERDMNYKVQVLEGKARGKFECQINESFLPFVVRTRKNGDRILSKKLKERFIDLKIPYWRRSFWPVFEKNGEIFFVPGVFKKEVKEGTIKVEVKEYERGKFSIFD